MSVQFLIKVLKGGRGSGNFGHAGRPGMLGGSSASYTITGADIGTLYHGGKTKIQKIDPERLQSRDSGYYGEGFYVTRNPEYAKAYGRNITKIELNPKASILNVSALRPEEADPTLVKDVLDSYAERGRQLAAQHNRLDKFEKNLPYELDNIKSNPISWAQAVKQFATAKNFDVVKYSDGEIVIRNLDAIQALKSLDT